MMSLYAPNATMTVGPGETASGLDEIRQFWLEKSASFEPENDWISDHPAYKLEITVNGDRGTLHFECHYVDAETGEVVAATAARLRRGPDRREVADHEHGRRHDRPGSLRSWREEQEPRVAREGRRRIGDPLVRAVARLPVKVRTKLLIAFVGTSLLLVAVGLLGQLVLGQSNDRVASLGPLQERADRVRPAPARRASTSGSSCRENAGADFNVDLAGCSDRGPERLASRSICSRWTRPIRVEAGTAAGSARLHAASGRPGRPAERSRHGRSALRRLMRWRSSSRLYRRTGRPRPRTAQEMLPTRAEAELLASDLEQTPPSWRTGRGQRSRS